MATLRQSPRDDGPLLHGDLTRREALAFLGAAGAATLTGCNLNPTDGATADNSTTTDSGSLACVLTPAQTEGPYFVDERLNRADIRSDPTTGEVESGLPLRLRINVAQVSGS